MAPVVLSASLQGSGDILVPGKAGDQSALLNTENEEQIAAAKTIAQNFGHSTSRLAKSAPNSNQGDKNTEEQNTAVGTIDAAPRDNLNDSISAGDSSRKQAMYDRMLAEDATFELQISNCKGDDAEHHASNVNGHGKMTGVSQEMFNYQNRARSNNERVVNECRSLDEYLIALDVGDRRSKSQNSNEVSFIDNGSIGHHAGGDASFSYRRGSDRADTPTEDMREQVEQERLRRKHCEDQIKELHSRCLDLEQQLAVAKDSIRKKDNSLQGLDQTMNQLISKWRSQENDRQEKIKETVAEKDRLATAVSSQQGVIETFEKDFTEAIGQIEFLQQKNKRLEEQLHSTVEEKKADRVELERKIGDLEKKNEGWKGEREELLKQKNKLVSERDKLKKEAEETGKKMDQLQNKANKEASTEKKLLEAEYKKCKDLRKEITGLQKTLESLNQQLESERSEKNSLAAEMESHTSRHSAEVSRVRENCEREAEAKSERVVQEAKSEWEWRMGEERRRHSAEMRKLETTFKVAMESVRNELASEGEEKRREMGKVVEELEQRNHSLHTQLSLLQARQHTAHTHTLELKRCFERNYVEVMNLIDRTMSSDSHVTAEREPYKRPASEQDSYSAMVPQKLVNSPSQNLQYVPNVTQAANFSSNASYAAAANAQQLSANYSNPSTASISQHLAFGYRQQGNPNSIRESTANASGLLGPTERLELPPPMGGGLPSSGVGSRNPATTGLTSSTPAGVQFYSAGTTPSDETETAPFASRESFDQEAYGDTEDSKDAQSGHRANEEEESNSVQGHGHPAGAGGSYSHYSHTSSNDSKEQSGSGSGAWQWPSMHSTNMSGSCMNSSALLFPMSKHSQAGRLDNMSNFHAVNSTSFEDSTSTSKSSRNLINANISLPFHSSSTHHQDSSTSKLSSKQTSYSHEHETAKRSASLNDSISNHSGSSIPHAAGDITSHSRNSMTKKSVNSSSSAACSKSGSSSAKSVGLAPSARFTVSFHSHSESPSPLLPPPNEKSRSSSSNCVKSRKLFHSSGDSQSNDLTQGSYSHSGVHLSSGWRSLSPDSGDNRDPRDLREDEDNGYDVDDQLLSDVSSETLAINSSSPVPRGNEQEKNELSSNRQPIGNGHGNNIIGQKEDRKRLSELTTARIDNDVQSDRLNDSRSSINSSIITSGHLMLTSMERLGSNATPPVKQPAGATLGAGSNMASVTMPSDGSGKELSADVNLEQRDKELQNYIQMLLSNPGGLGFDAFMGSGGSANNNNNSKQFKHNEAVLSDSASVGVTENHHQHYHRHPHSDDSVVNGGNGTESGFTSQRESSSQKPSVNGAATPNGNAGGAVDKRQGVNASTVKMSSKGTTMAKPWK